MANVDTYLPQGDTRRVDGVHEDSAHPHLQRVGVGAGVLHFHQSDNVTRTPLPRAEGSRHGISHPPGLLPTAKAEDKSVSFSAPIVAALWAVHSGVTNVPGFSVSTILDMKWHMLAPLAFDSWFRVDDMRREAKEQFEFDFFFKVIPAH